MAQEQNVLPCFLRLGKALCLGHVHASMHVRATHEISRHKPLLPAVTEECEGTTLVLVAYQILPPLLLSLSLLTSVCCNSHDCIYSMDERTRTASNLLLSIAC
jgi:hypothetical protein